MLNMSLLDLQRKSKISMSQFVLRFIKHQSLQSKRDLSMNSNISHQILPSYGACIQFTV